MSFRIIPTGPHTHRKEWVDDPLPDPNAPRPHPCEFRGADARDKSGRAITRPCPPGFRSGLG